MEVSAVFGKLEYNTDTTFETQTDTHTRRIKNHLSLTHFKAVC